MTTSLRAAAFLLLLGCAVGGVRADDAPPEPPHARLTPEITPEQVLTRVALLASDEFEGRESGLDGGRRAEEWVALEMRRFGLEPLSATPGSPYTDVPLPGRAVPEQSFLEIGAAPAAPRRLSAADGARPFSFGKDGDVEGPLVFAGFGLSAPTEGYDDFAGVDAKGKVLLVLRHGPGEKNAKSPWHDTTKKARELAFSAKARRAAEAGAVALLLVNDMNHAADALPTNAPGEPASIPVFAVNRAVADLLLAPLGKTLAQLQAEIDGDMQPRSAVVPGVSVHAHAVVAATTASNVVFVRRGTDEKLRDEAVLVCAHMDHVGRGLFGTMSPKDAGKIHPGADDNASGTAALLEVAEAMTAGADTKRTLVFAAWCAEEKGLLGSEHYCDHPLWPLEKTAVVVNMDMVGRYRGEADEDGLRVCGMPTALGCEAAVARAAAAQGLKTSASWEAWEESDQFSFYVKGVPALFVHTGLHADYHRPGDVWWKVAAEPEARIAKMVVDLTRELADSPERPKFAKKPPRPVLGVQLGDADGGAGAAIRALTPGRGAELAGLLAGDVVTSFNGSKVTSAADLSKLIAATKPDDVVDVVYRRATEERSAKVTISGL